MAGGMLGPEACSMIGAVDRTSLDGADSVDGYRRRMEEILLTTRWVAVPLCLAMIPFLPKASPISIGLIAGGLALGNLVIAIRLRWASPPWRPGVICGMATVLEWLAALGMVLAGGASPTNPIPAVLILVILIDGLRFGT